MPDDLGSERFDASKAELFEALGHPLRLAILEALEESSLGFSSLKRQVGLMSSGNLQFHLGKLAGLVLTLPDGSYSLSDEGREALRVVRVSAGRPSVSGKLSGRRIGSRTVIVSLLAIIIVLGSIVVIQQMFLTNSGRPVSPGNESVVSLNGIDYYFMILPIRSPTLNLSTDFHNVTFSYVALGYFYVLSSSVQGPPGIAPDLYNTTTFPSWSSFSTPSIEVTFSEKTPARYSIMQPNGQSASVFYMADRNSSVTLEPVSIAAPGSFTFVSEGSSRAAFLVDVNLSVLELLVGVSGNS
ncbi:MAG TPA: winged helix-turn-helix domain-containing protein [Conexivisphaerales archaeon]|nr:winged helix-turn-helix domain-containing protein [Conexivisphaerales archaeon]